ncbi:MAG: alpha/beta hydrolase family protein [Candidatus Poribacteria bacterium]
MEFSLQNEVVSACRGSLSKGVQKRRSIKTNYDYKIWRDEIIKIIKSAFPEEIFKPVKQLTSKVVSRYEFDSYNIENVIFESLSGWEVNGSVYLPKQGGIYPGVICPTGHSTKTGESYQKSAQVFARNGYIAISFDPPGCAGENANLNDHFTNGLIGYLTGFWSQTHFVIDAIRCIDYLLTRQDIDLNAGISITGVSGGGVTSFFTTLLDDRIAFVAPVCCLNDHETLHLTGLYTSCPEQFGYGYIANGIDYTDYISAIAPRPCLIIGGKDDEVFDYNSTIRIYKEAKAVYKSVGCPENIGIFIDQNSGHAYTVDMANEVVRWMNRFIKKTNSDPVPLKDEQVSIVDREKLLCYPSSKSNMFTVNRDEAIRLKNERKLNIDGIRSKAKELLGISADIKHKGIKLIEKPRTSWQVLFERLVIQSAENVYLPALMLTHVEDKLPNPGLLWIDENGRWASLLHGEFLCQALRMFEPNCLPNQPRILSIDVSGFGLLSPEPTAYDLAGWNNIEQILTYLSIANAKPIMGLRVRDGLCGLDYLLSRPEVDKEKIIVGGRGIGAIVALHIALLNSKIRRVICLDMLSHYGALTEKFPFLWRHSIIIPNILKYYDLPDMIAELDNTEVFIINPMDAQKNKISQESANELYSKAISNGTIVKCEVDGRTEVISAIYK